MTVPREFSDSEPQILVKHLINKIIESDQPHLKSLEIARVHFGKLSIGESIWKAFFNTGINVKLINCKYCNQEEEDLVTSRATMIWDQDYFTNDYLKRKTIIKLLNY